MGIMQNGFTLIELSIVLVIIGLVAGGVLVGRDLIQASEMQASARQLEQYKTAMYTFRSKYNALPGDMMRTIASDLDFTARSGAYGHGDGNGHIEHCDDNDPNTMLPPLGCEIVLFWSDLSRAGLIADNFTAAVDGPFTITSFEDSTRYYPRSKLVNTATLIPGTHRQSRRLWLAQIHIDTYDGVGSMNYEARTLYPEIAYRMDTKLDDGDPRNGNVIAFSSAASDLTRGFFFQDPFSGPFGCIENNSYNTDYKGYPVCQLNFAM